MAWKITDSLITAELDNREEGRVTGTLQLVGQAEPIRLELEGNFLRDIAGCRLTIRNPRPLDVEASNLAPLQKGRVGDMTASHKIRVMDVPVDQALQLRSLGRPVPSHWGNCVVLEWFSEANGRVVVENVDFEIGISEPAWTLPPPDADALLTEFLELAAASSAETGVYPLDEEPDLELDEFAWEREFRESDERTAEYLRLMEQFEGDPNRDAEVAKAMGWDPADVFDAALVEWDELEEQGLEPDPDPETEGILWVRSADNRIVHPLYETAYRVAMDLWMLCENAGLLGEQGVISVQQMVDSATQFTTKLAGALNCLYMDPSLEPGFTIALLKRSLPAFNHCMQAMERVLEEERIPDEILSPIQTRLHEVRQEVVRLMEAMRRQ